VQLNFASYQEFFAFGGQSFSSKIGDFPSSKTREFFQRSIKLLPINQYCFYDILLPKKILFASHVTITCFYERIFVDTLLLPMLLIEVKCILVPVIIYFASTYNKNESTWLSRLGIMPP
jgi:hypothetical protein